jgi:hypothetical protein
VIHFCLEYIVAGRRRRKRQKINLPPELQNLRVTIREDGTIDLGVCREALIEYLRKCAERDLPDTDGTSTPGLE